MSSQRLGTVGLCLWNLSVTLGAIHYTGVLTRDKERERKKLEDENTARTRLASASALALLADEEYRFKPNRPPIYATGDSLAHPL